MNKRRATTIFGNEQKERKKRGVAAIGDLKK
jgi:hypothetical protein